MNLLKTQSEIKAWLNFHDIQNYKIIKDRNYGFVVNVNGSVNLENKNLKWIDVKFKKIKGDFYCGYNQLVSLKGSPETVGGNFFCHNNELDNLEFCPELIDGSFDCSNNKLQSLLFCPYDVGGYFFCHCNEDLKQIQIIDVFQEIFKIHQEQVIMKRHQKMIDLLEASIKIQDNAKTIKKKL